jgi:diguanylate cyclase (GGDEF)-like protein
LRFENKISDVDSYIEQLQKRLADLNIPHDKSNVSPVVTISIGVYITRCGTHDDINKLLEYADKALYKAKNGGRNNAVVCGDEIRTYILKGI